MRPITVIRIVLMSLLILAGLTLFFQLMAPGAGTVAPPRLIAERVGDRIYVAYIGRSSQSSPRYAMTAIPSEKLIEWSDTRKESSGSMWSSTPEGEESPWLEVQRGSGELLGLRNLDGSVAQVFDGVIVIHDQPEPGTLGEAGKKLITTDNGRERRVRITRSTMGLDDALAETFNSFLPADLDVMVTPLEREGEGEGEGEQSDAGDGSEDTEGGDGAERAGHADNTVGAAQTQSAPHRLAPDADLLLTVIGLDRFVRLRLDQQTSLATTVGPPCFLSLDPESHDLIVLDKAPATERPGHIGLPGTDAPTEETNASTIEDNDDENEKTPRFERMLNLAVIDSPGTDPRTHADVLVSVELRLLEKANPGDKEPSLVRRYALYLVQMRDGKWQKPALVSRHVRFAWDVEADPANPDLQHLLFVYNAPGKSSKWKYRRLDLRKGIDQLETPVTEVGFAGTSRVPPSLLFELVVADDRLHLFQMDQGRPVHSMAGKPAADSDERLPDLTFGPIQSLDAFRGRSSAEELMTRLVVITMIVIVVTVLTAAIRVRRHKLEQEAAEAATSKKAPDIDLDADAEQSGERDRPGAATGDSPPADNAPPDESRKPSSDGREDVDWFDPESVKSHFGYFPASVPVRFFALAVDAMILLVPLYLLSDWMQLNIDDLGSWSSPDFFPTYILMCALHLIYFSLLEYYFERTPGKMMFGLRVRNLEKDARPLSYPRHLIRNAVRGLDYFAFLLMFVSDRSQRIGDRMSGMVVIRDEEPAEEGGTDDDDMIR